MNFIHRKIEKVVLDALDVFPALVLTGPRRAGKTCLLRNLFPQARYVQLEDPDTLELVASDPRGFLDSLELPVIIDEIQQLPQLFQYIRSRIDASPEARGKWILTGSQETLLMKGVSESMAGRAAILRLPPFSVQEDDRVSPLNGGYPEALAFGRRSELWFSSYVQTYLERDVRSVLAVRNLMTFHRFLKLLATRHGQMLNKTDLAAPLGISVPTVGEWLNVLETSGLVFRVPPYYQNLGKRLVKTPKVYFSDSGLACHLLGIRTMETLARSPFYGALFEGFVLSEIVKSQLARGREGDVYYFRDEQGLEVDLVLPMGDGRLVLGECKSSATLSTDMSIPMRRLADCVRRQGMEAEQYLIHCPSSSTSGVRQVGPGVRSCSVRQFVETVGKDGTG